MPTQDAAYTDTASLLRAQIDHPGVVLLDGGGSDSWGDGSGLFTHSPRATLEVFASGAGRIRRGGAETWQHGAPLSQWQAFLDAANPADDPAAGGFLSVLAYDLKHWIERLPRRHAWPTTPILYCAHYDWCYRLDHRARKATIEVAAAAAAGRRAEELGRLLNAPPVPAPATVPLRPTMSKAEYRQLVERALAYIAAGDVYQVNLAQRFAAPATMAQCAPLLAEWRRRYPMPFAAYVDGGAWQIASNSPECFFVTDRRSLSTFPIKGTRASDSSQLEPLAHDPKECAEHVMIVDLERNDIGRVCRTGTVKVIDMATVRAYPLLTHMVSEVCGTLRPDTNLAALAHAMFPGGSITGAPKIRAMEIIEELEPCARGFYTGAIGWTDWRGRSRFNLAIRTAVFADGVMSYHAGGGIVADSIAEREYDETLLKSEAFFDTWSSMGTSESCDRLASSS